MCKKIKIEAKGYGVIQRDFMTMDIDVYAKCVYALLRTYSGDKTSCYPSLNTITKDLKISKNTAIKAVKILESINMIAVRRSKKSGKNENSVNVYIPLSVMVEIDLENHDFDTENEEIGSAPDAPRSAPHALGVVHHVHRKNNNINNNKEEGLNLNDETSSSANQQVEMFVEDGFTSKQKQTKKPAKKQQTKVAHPSHVPIKKYWFEDFNKGAKFSPGDGEHINRIIQNIEVLFISRNQIADPQSIIDFFKMVCVEKKKINSNFISNSGLSVLGSSDSFMSIINSIDQNGKPKNNISNADSRLRETINMFANF